MPTGYGNLTPLTMPVSCCVPTTGIVRESLVSPEEKIQSREADRVQDGCANRPLNTGRTKRERLEEEQERRQTAPRKEENLLSSARNSRRENRLHSFTSGLNRETKNTPGVYVYFLPARLFKKFCLHEVLRFYNPTERM